MAAATTHQSMGMEPLRWPTVETLGGFSPLQCVANAKVGLTLGGRQTTVRTTLTTRGGTTYQSLTSLWRPKRASVSGASPNKLLKFSKQTSLFLSRRAKRRRTSFKPWLEWFSEEKIFIGQIVVKKAHPPFTFKTFCLATLLLVNTLRKVLMFCTFEKYTVYLCMYFMIFLKTGKMSQCFNFLLSHAVVAQILSSNLCVDGKFM